MRLASNPSSRGGWLLADEGDTKDLYVSPTYTVAWGPETRFDEAEYFIPGERKGDYAEFSLRVKDGTLVLEEGEAILRFAFHHLRMPLDALGVPFVQVLPYIGDRLDVLDRHGKAGFRAFLALAPLDLMLMDYLYLKSRIIFVGVTASFGPHVNVRG